MSSETPDVIFIWIPKTAGSGIYKVLSQYGCAKRLWKQIVREPVFVDRGISTFGHVDIQACLEQGVLDRDYYERAFKFCFVRNPWDRFRSYHAHLVRHYKLKRRFFPDTVASFDKFVHSMKERKILKIGFFNSKNLSPLNNQVEWITDDSGKLIVDFVGRFENLDEDVQKVFSRIGIEGVLKRTRNTKPSDVPPYPEIYTDETREIIRQMYQRDISLFEYEF